MDCDYLVVGAGIFGAVVAESIANNLRKKVLVIDKRKHIGGNCYSKIDSESGIEYHVYGTHIFHTSFPQVYHYIERFDELNGYHHQVLTAYKGKIYQMPINLETINSFYKKNFTPEEAQKFIRCKIAKEGIKKPKNLEEKAISQVGRDLYEAFIKGYTAKQWGRDPKKLPAEIINRLPVRFDYREDYFNDARWQGIPIRGFGKLIESILRHKNISIILNCDYFKVKDEISFKNKMIFTGPIDSFYHYRFGRLEWRSVSFEKRLILKNDFQGTSVINIAEKDIGYTRIHEPKHLHPERNYPRDKTIIFYENPLVKDDEPFYPVNSCRNMELLSKYRSLAKKEKKILFGGRLGSYAYLDMDKAILSAIECSNAL